MLAIDQGRKTMLGVGLVLLGLGVAVFLRPAPSESAVYIRRIAGMMLFGFGLALSVFAVGLSLAAAG